MAIGPAAAIPCLPLAAGNSTCEKLRQAVCRRRPPVVRSLRRLGFHARKLPLLLLQGALLVLLCGPAHGQLLEGPLQRRLLALPPPGINCKQRLLVSLLVSLLLRLLLLLLRLCLLLRLLRLLLLLLRPPLLLPPLLCSARRLTLDDRRLSLLATCTEQGSEAVHWEIGNCSKEQCTC